MTNVDSPTPIPQSPTPSPVIIASLTPNDPVDHSGIAPDSSTFYQIVNDVWPDLQAGNALISPPRNGVNRYTGKMLSGWPHVEQSMEIIFSTPFHSRVLRRWVGSFVPHILGQNAVSKTIVRFFWAIVTAIDLWEPDYRIQHTYVMGNAIQNWSPTGTLANTDVNQLLRQGQLIFRTEGQWYPRAHLGDYTPYIQKSAGLINRGANLWNVIAVANNAA